MSAWLWLRRPARSWVLLLAEGSRWESSDIKYLDTGIQTGNWKYHTLIHSYIPYIHTFIHETGNWKLEIGNWKLETGNWKLETGNWKLETGNWKLDSLAKSEAAGNCQLSCKLCSKLETVDCSLAWQELQTGNWKLEAVECRFTWQGLCSKLETGYCSLARRGQKNTQWTYRKRDNIANSFSHALVDSTIFFTVQKFCHIQNICEVSFPHEPPLIFVARVAYWNQNFTNFWQPAACGGAALGAIIFPPLLLLFFN